MEKTKRKINKNIFVLGAFVASIGLHWTIVEITDRFLDNAFFTDLNFPYIYVMIVHSLIVALIAFVIHDKFLEPSLIELKPQNAPEGGIDDILINSIENSINESHSKQEYNNIIRLGSALSRPLWLSGKYKTRIKLGALVEDASARSMNKDEQARALIDDIGWTNAELGNFDIAIKKISHGKNIAESTNNLYLKTKALRHLGAIEKRKGNFQKAKEIYDECLEEVKSVKPKKVRQVLEAGIYYALGLLEFEQNQNINSAEDYIQKGINIYKKLDDYDRWLKSLSIKANFHLNKGNIQKAKDLFREGLTLSKTHNRINHIYKNIIGLIEIAKKEDNLNVVSELKKEAEEIEKLIGTNN